MNKRIKELYKEVVGKDWAYDFDAQHAEKFAELLIAEVLHEVAERAYYSGDRAWSDDLDRPWVEQKFGIG